MDEFQDWEVLQPSSDFESAPIISTSFDEFDSGGSIQPDYFSLDAKNLSGQDLDDNKSAKSDNPSWIDPEDPARYLNKEPCEFWSDSSSERSEDRKFTDLEGRIEMGSQGIREIVEEKGEITVGSAEFDDSVENSEVSVENLHENENRGSGGEIEKKGVAWWKMPMEILKHCATRMSPVWTISMAAALMGFLVLSRRLYSMKKKARGLQIKVAVDDKKVSQVMSRAARLNEAFSVVKRAPLVRPSLPAVGMTNWPVMSLR